MKSSSDYLQKMYSEMERVDEQLEMVSRYIFLRQECIKAGRGSYISQDGVHIFLRQGCIYFKTGRGAYIS